MIIGLSYKSGFLKKMRNKYGLCYYHSQAAISLYYWQKGIQNQLSWAYCLDFLFRLWGWVQPEALINPEGIYHCLIITTFYNDYKLITIINQKFEIN